MTPVKIKKNPPQKVIHPIPPHTGMGSEEDSLLSVYFLRPEAKIKEIYSALNYKSKIKQKFVVLKIEPSKCLCS